MPLKRQGATRTHNEWFQPVAKQAYGGGSRCPCGLSRSDRVKQGLDPDMYACGEYVRSKWNNWGYCCQGCWSVRIIPQLRTHADPCGCAFQLCARSGHILPPWITLAGSGIRCAA
jgi:hypothetical protein